MDSLSVISPTSLFHSERILCHQRTQEFLSRVLITDIIFLAAIIVSKFSVPVGRSDLILAFTEPNTLSTGATSGQYAGRKFISFLNFFITILVTLEQCITTLSAR
ncbi:unnamed protein product [Moneuplotes crassus]|uniref:Uncharacterized protein n=1 Tax=Euplotes crassus TaxID=5936 RepID=A0AAD1UJN6_EUPCR|nr:unnamed protein product [Moneuplotes crassus]